MKRPNFFLYIVLGFFVKIYAYVKGQRIIKHAKINRPAIILSNHTSFYDFIYTTAAMYPYRVSYLAAKKMFYEKPTGFFLRLARAIPKSLMQADPIATRHALRLLRNKGIIAIFPEGQISPNGRSLSPAFSIAKFIRKAHVDVYMVKHYGAGLVNPPWSKRSFKGRIETVKEHIISKESLKNLSDEAIYDLVVEKLYVSLSAYNKTKRYTYKLQDINNLENVIYQCPLCLHEGLESHKNHLYCPSCGQKLMYDQYGLLNGQGVDELYLKQEERIRKEIDATPDYHIHSSVRLMSFRNQKLVEVGQGILTLKPYLYLYQGTIDDTFKTISFKVSSTPTLPSDIGRNVQIYEADTIYQFEMDNTWMPTKMVHVGEYLYHKQKENDIDDSHNNDIV